MSDQPPPPTGTAFDDASAPSPQERDLRVLDELVEIGMQIARAIGRQAAAQSGGEPAGEVVRGDIAAAYDRVARAVRLGIMLKARLGAEAATLKTAPPREGIFAGLQADRARLDREDERKARVERIVERIAQAQHNDKAHAERLAEEAAERLDQDDIYGDVLSRPVSDLIAALCADLGLSPDWPRLAKEAWAKAEIAGGAVGSPLAALEVRAPPGGGECLTAADPFGFKAAFPPLSSSHGRPPGSDQGSARGDGPGDPSHAGQRAAPS